MPNSNDKDGSVIRRALLSPVISSNVTVCGARQVPKRQFSDLPRAGSPEVRREIKEFLRGTRTYWQERGWRCYGNVYVGSYRVNGSSYAGLARKEATGTVFDFYVIDPPPRVRRSPCFRDQGEGWYWVHWHKENAPRTVCAGLMGIEKKLAELFRV